jgi:hypothetical protein
MCSDADWGVLTYTFHPFVIGRGHRLVMFDALIRGLAEMDAEFVTAEAAVREFQGRSSSPA